MEPVIVDSQRYTLVVFSASWCVPCHEQVPVIRKIIKDLEPALNLTYISIDDSSTVDNWRGMMKAGELPGRSLVSYQMLEEVKRKYFVDVIPYSFLIDPLGNLEIVDFRLDLDREKIYKLLGYKK